MLTNKSDNGNSDSDILAVVVLKSETRPRPSKNDLKTGLKYYKFWYSTIDHVSQMRLLTSLLLVPINDLGVERACSQYSQMRLNIA